MEYEYLMNIASVLFIVCQIPELQANYKNKNANLWNVPEKGVILLGTGFAFVQAFLKQDQALLLNYGPILGLDLVAFSMRAQYAYRNQRSQTIQNDMENPPIQEPVESV